jgi:hypothetical protein
LDPVFRPPSGPRVLHACVCARACVRVCMCVACEHGMCGGGVGGWVGWRLGWVGGVGWGGGGGWRVVPGWDPLDPRRRAAGHRLVQGGSPAAAGPRAAGWSRVGRRPQLGLNLVGRPAVQAPAGPPLVRGLCAVCKPPNNLLLATLDWSGGWPPSRSKGNTERVERGKANLPPIESNGLRGLNRADRRS